MSGPSYHHFKSPIFSLAVRTSQPADHDPGAEILCVAGGGGSSKTGISNKIVTFTAPEFSDSSSPPQLRVLQEVPTGEQHLTTAVAVSPGGTQLAALSNHDVMLYRFNRGSEPSVRLAGTFTAMAADDMERTLSSLAYMDAGGGREAVDGTQLVVGDENGAVRAWSVPPPRPSSGGATDVSAVHGAPATATVAAHLLWVAPLAHGSRKVEGIAVAAPEGWIASASADGRVLIWDDPRLCAPGSGSSNGSGMAGNVITVTCHALGPVGGKLVANKYTDPRKKAANAWRYRAVAFDPNTSRHGVSAPGQSRVLYALESSERGAAVLSKWVPQQQATSHGATSDVLASVPCEVQVTLGEAPHTDSGSDYSPSQPGGLRHRPMQQASTRPSPASAGSATAAAVGWRCVKWVVVCRTPVPTMTVATDTRDGSSGATLIALGTSEGGLLVLNSSLDVVWTAPRAVHGFPVTSMALLQHGALASGAADAQVAVSRLPPPPASLVLRMLRSLLWLLVLCALSLLAVLLLAPRLDAIDSLVASGFAALRISLPNASPASTAAQQLRAALARRLAWLSNLNPTR